MADSKGAMHVDTALVRQLAKLLDDSNLSEIEVEDGGRRIRVARTMSAAPVHHAAPSPPPAAAPVPPPADKPAETGDPVKSPMVGTVYLSADPGSKPFVAVGDTISEGQTIVIVEAMKVMNPIPSPRAGKVTRICVENGQPVEYDQSLIIIDPSTGSGQSG